MMQLSLHYSSQFLRMKATLQQVSLKLLILCFTVLSMVAILVYCHSATCTIRYFGSIIV
jgi:hypothetical protein